MNDEDNSNTGSPTRKKPGKNIPSGFLKYSGLAMQMLGTILIFTYAGFKLDESQSNKVPVWTLVLSLLSIAGSLYMLIKSFTKQ